MNRRGFLDTILRAGISSMILPSAINYTRKWKRSRELYLPDIVFDVCYDFTGSRIKSVLAREVWSDSMGETKIFIL